MKTSQIMIVTAMLLAAACAGIVLMDEESDAEVSSITVQYKVNGVTYAAGTIDGKTVTLLTPGEGILAGVSSEYFLGWQVDGEGSTYSAGSTYTPPTGSGAVNVTFVAAYQNYTVSFFENTAQNSQTPAKGDALALKTTYDASVTPGTVIVLPGVEDFQTDVPTPDEGMQFIGWYIEGELYSEGAQYTVTKNVDAIAAYNNGYTVTFISNGSVINTLTTTEPLAKGDFPTPALTGHTFIGWDIDGDKKADLTPAVISAEGFEYAMTADITMTAVFEAATMTMTFTYGDNIFTQTVLYGDLAVKPELPAGYAEWCIQTGVDTEGKPIYEIFDFTRPITEDMALIAVESAPDENIYVTFNIEGKIEGPYVVTDRFSIPNTDRDGYIFAGWIIEGGDGTKYTNEQVSNFEYTEDVTFVATYDPEPAPEGPGFFETTAGKAVAVIIVFAIIAFVACYVMNYGGLRDKLSSVKIVRVKKE